MYLGRAGYVNGNARKRVWTTPGALIMTGNKRKIRSTRASSKINLPPRAVSLSPCLPVKKT